MASNKHHLQLRLSPMMRNELSQISSKLHLRASDVVRGALFFGMPIFAAMTDLQSDLNRRLIKSLKAASRKKRTN
jgi:hypothetical protein